MSEEAWGVARVVIAVLGTAVAWWAVHWASSRRPTHVKRFATTRQVAQVTIVVIGIVAVILALPVEAQIKGALVGALGVALAAVIGLSSTTIVGNALAGIMLRSVNNFTEGDWISVEGHIGKVSYRRLLATEIETEHQDLTTLPNLYLATHPVKVIEKESTIVSATVSLGYDVNPIDVKRLLASAVRATPLGEPIHTYVIDLGDHAVTYRVSGKLQPVKELMRARSELRIKIFECLREAGIEIVSPQFVNRREFDSETPIIAAPPTPVASRETPNPEETTQPKSTAAGDAQALREARDNEDTRLAELRERLKAADEKAAVALSAQISATEARIAKLTGELEAAVAEVEALDD